MGLISSKSWDIHRNMPSQAGKVAIVTGGSSGLGKEIVKQLALRGATVYMAARNEGNAKKAIEELEKVVKSSAARGGTYSEGKIVFLKLDLCDLKGCIEAAKVFLSKEDRLDILSAH